MESKQLRKNYAYNKEATRQYKKLPQLETNQTHQRRSIIQDRMTPLYVVNGGAQDNISIKFKTNKFKLNSKEGGNRPNYGKISTDLHERGRRDSLRCSSQGFYSPSENTDDNDDNITIKGKHSITTSTHNLINLQGLALQPCLLKTIY